MHFFRYGEIAMFTIPRNYNALRDFLYDNTTPGGNYNAKITINCVGDECIMYESKRSKPSSATPITNHHTVDDLLEKLNNLMPTNAESLDAEIAFIKKEDTLNFTVKISRDDNSNVSQQSAQTELGSIFENGRRYSARFAHK